VKKHIWLEGIMEEKQSQEPEEQHPPKQRKSNSFAFLAYAVVVFSFLAVGLAVILMRSNQ